MTEALDRAVAALTADLERQEAIFLRRWRAHVAKYGPGAPWQETNLFNPYHEPAGSSKGGQFARKSSVLLPENSKAMRAAVTNDAYVDSDGTTDYLFAAIADELGFNEVPEVVSATTLTDMVNAGGIELWRGIWDEDANQAALWAEQFRSGIRQVGLGAGGSGTNATTEHDYARKYAVDERSLLHMVLKPGSKVISRETAGLLQRQESERLYAKRDVLDKQREDKLDQLQNAWNTQRASLRATSVSPDDLDREYVKYKTQTDAVWEKYRREDRELDRMRWALTPSRVALLYGYDAIRADFYVILNRGAIAVEAGHAS